MNLKKSQSMKISVLPEQEKELSSKERISLRWDFNVKTSSKILASELFVAAKK